MNFTSFIINFIKFKPIIKFKKFQRYNYDYKSFDSVVYPRLFVRSFVQSIFVLNYYEILEKPSLEVAPTSLATVSYCDL